MHSGFWWCWGDSGQERCLFYHGHYAVNWYPKGATAFGLRPYSTWKRWGIDLGRLVIRRLPITASEFHKAHHQMESTLAE